MEAIDENQEKKGKIDKWVIFEKHKMTIVKKM